MEPEVH